MGIIELSLGAVALIGFGLRTWFPYRDQRKHLTVLDLKNIADDAVRTVERMGAGAASEDKVKRAIAMMVRLAGGLDAMDAALRKAGVRHGRLRDEYLRGLVESAVNNLPPTRSR